MKILWFVNLAILLAFIKIFETPPLIPILAEDLGITYEQAGIFMTAYALMRCVGSSPGGYISDRWGAVRVIMVCLLGIGVCGLLATFGSNYIVMLLLRILVSLGVAVIFIASIDSIPKYLPPEKVGNGVGLINVSLNIGITVALLLTPMLAEAYGWRWTARAYSAAFLILFIVSLPFIRGMPPATQTARTANTEPVSFAQLWRNPFVILLALATSVLFVELYGVLTWVPAYLKDVYGYSPAEIGTSAMMFGLAAIPASMLTGYLCTSLRNIVWLCVSGGVICGLGILALLNWIMLSPIATATIIAVLTWGHSQMIVTIMSLASLIVPPHSSGKALGLIFTVGYGGAILPTYLGGYLVTKTGNYTVSFLVFASSAFVTIAVLLAVYRLLKTRPPSHFSFAAT